MALRLSILPRYLRKIISSDATKCLYTNKNKLINYNLISLNSSLRTLSTAGFNDIIFRQLFDEETWTFTYLIGDKSTREAVLIDPVFEQVERDLKLVEELQLNLKYAMNTHMHADHITGSGLIKVLLPSVKSLIAKDSGAAADVKVVHNEIVTFGNQSLEVRSTPGHTNGCVTYVDHAHKVAFTGDSLLIRGCGRTDFQEGNPKTLYESIKSQIFSLPNFFMLYPAHDYHGHTVTTVEEEMKYNTRLTKTETEFVKIMETLELPYPHKIDESVPANKVCGLYDLPKELARKLEEAKLLKP